MPRVREIDDPGDDPILKETFAKELETFGFVLNTTKVQAHTPGIMKAAKQLSAAVDRDRKSTRLNSSHLVSRMPSSA